MVLTSHSVSESGVWLLIARGQVGGKFASLGILQPGNGVGEGGCLSKGQLPPLTTSGHIFYRLREGATCRNSTVSSDIHLELVIGSLMSIISIV